MGFPIPDTTARRRPSSRTRGETRRGTSSDSSKGGEGERWCYGLLSSPVVRSRRRYPPWGETPCPLNGVTGLPWLRGTPWNRRHRRTQRKAHLFWKNIIRTVRHEPHPRLLLAATCIPVYNELVALRTVTMQLECTRFVHSNAAPHRRRETTDRPWKNKPAR